MTLAQVIAAHEQRQAAEPTPIRRAAAGALTPRGHAAISLYRFTRQLRTLSPEDRAYMLGMLGEELNPA